MRTVGWVSSSRTEPLDDDWDSVIGTITLDADQFTPEALWGLDEFSHVEVLYLFDRHRVAVLRWPAVPAAVSTW